MSAAFAVTAMHFPRELRVVEAAEFWEADQI